MESEIQLTYRQKCASLSDPSSKASLPTPNLHPSVGAVMIEMVQRKWNQCLSCRPLVELSKKGQSEALDRIENR